MTRPEKLPAAPYSAPFTAPDLPLSLRINGETFTLKVPPQTTLLDLLRERLHLSGTKKGCDHGQCGACTVHVGGKAHLACLTLALTLEGRDVITIEGVGSGEALDAMQQAFIDHDAFQCGYCTPGQIMSALACVQRGEAGSDDSVREFMSGNLCRCAAYPQIVAAISSVARAGES